DAGHSSLGSKAGFDEGPRVEHAQELVDEDLEKEVSEAASHLFALGRRRVKSVVGKVASEDVQLTGNYPPWIPQIHFVLWRKKGFELPGK
ncbi:hypothetical protein N307_14717, partial [Dryobates pubescens]